MNVAIVSSEVTPFSKSGGLGDVAGSLSRALHHAGHRVMTVSPRYGSVDRSGLVDTGIRVEFHLGSSPQQAQLWVHTGEGPTHVLVEHPVFADRAGLYGDQHGSFGDNHLRFALLQRAALEAARRVEVDGETLGNEPVFHVHDWQTASLPAYLEQFYRPLGFFVRSPVVLTVHNPAHQGRLPAAMFQDLDLPARWFTPDALEWHGDLALLKCGLVLADRITTVSPSYAWEVTTPEGGFGLDALFRGRFAEFTGILNGIDNAEWDPAHDAFLDAPYDVTDLSGKEICKAALQAELGLPVDDCPLFGVVGRVDPQKGTDLILESLPWLVEQGAQIVFLGSAAAAFRELEQRLRAAERRYPQNVRAWIGFSERLAHRIEAGADYFLMPSLYEPCGLNQMYSQRYGTPPIVRRTGGLIDSVEDGVTGFSFTKPTGFALRSTMHRALELYGTDALTEIRLAGMRKQLGWDHVIEAYLAVYQEAAASRSRWVDR